jgi:hypothetical protein
VLGSKPADVSHKTPNQRKYLAKAGNGFSVNLDGNRTALSLLPNFMCQSKGSIAPRSIGSTTESGLKSLLTMV